MSELSTFFNQDLDKPGVTGLAKKHERLILFVAAMIGIIGVVIAYQKSQGVSTSSNPNSVLTAGSGGGQGSTGTTVTTSNPVTSTLSILENLDNSVGYSGGQQHNSAFGLNASLGGIFGKGFGINSSKSSSSYTQGQANQATGIQGNISGTSEDINNYLNHITTTEGSYAQRLAGSEALLALEEKGGKQ